MQFLSNLGDHIHLPHFHIHYSRRRHQRPLGDPENGHANITAPTLVRPIDDVINDPDNYETAYNRSDPVKTYRILPIFSGVMIPFSIMLSIPSLTGHWYIRTDNNVTTEIQPNPVLLDVGLALSMACGVLASAFLVVRFAERRVKLMTLLAIGFLTLHDLINIPIVTIFGVIHRFDDGFTYGQSFWFTVCSTVVSTATNITLIVDYIITKDFDRSGSGLTQPQRSLLIVVIVLLSYISFGALIQTKLVDVSFINALYFSVVTIETIGFGDLVPTTPSARIFTCFYIAGGVVNIALAVLIARDVILESAVAALRKRLLIRQHERRLRTRWRAAVRWRLQEKNRPTWVHHHHHRERAEECIYEGHWYSWILRLGQRLFRCIATEKEDPAWKFQHGPRHRRLNLEALTDADLNAAALEAGAPLSKLVPQELRINRHSPSGVPVSRRPTIEPGQVLPTSPTLTHFRLGGMLALMGNFAMAVTHHTNPDAGDDRPSSPPSPPSPDSSEEQINVTIEREPTSEPPRSGVPLTITSTIHDDDRSMDSVLSDDVKYLFYTRLGIALLVFITFWIFGSVIFMETEKWTFWSAVYFCFITFTTLGYGDMAPQTPAGRTFFIFWALLGVATMTILISVIVEAYTQRYKSVIKSEVFQASASMTSRPQLTEHLSFPTGVMDQGLLPVPANHSSYTRAMSRDTIALSPIKSAMKRPKTEKDSPVSYDTDEKQGGSFQIGSGSLSQSVLVHIDHLKSLITIARAQRDSDNSERLVNLISDLESALRDFDHATTPPDSIASDV